ncbi:MFS transporter [Caldivirga sp. MU80]|uniref:MFS transporter n=1 Tax=Caldivirga sp. MU80 TaxID=1650354 RepID=UPI00082C6D98|nr:MFS transporter [Caldivirga sp. MU80]
MSNDALGAINEGRREAILVNSFLGSLMASMTMSAIIIALPDILRGIGVNPMSPLGFASMMWLMFSYPLMVAVAVPIVGRLSDMYGRGKMFTIGDAIFTVMSTLLGIVPGYGSVAVAQMIAYRFVQGLGGSMMFTNSAAIITDVYPPHRRGVAMGIVSIAFSAGSIIGLVVGGVLAVVNWRLVFLVNTPIGIASTAWAYVTVYRLPLGLRRVRVDYLGASMLAASLVLLLLGITFGMLPSGNSMMSWGSPMVLGLIGGGLLLMALLIPVEMRTGEPILKINLFRIRPFTFGVLSALFLFLAQGANVFVLSLLLQAIYLPMHGVPYSETPLLAGIYLIPSSVANAVFAPVGGRLINRFGARVVSTIGAVLLGVSFELLTLLSLNFNYTLFAADLFLMGTGSGLFQSPNLVSIMSSVPQEDRSAASGLRASMQNIGLLMSFAVFLTLILVGSATALSTSISSALTKVGVPSDVVSELTRIPPAYALFAAFMGYDPMKFLMSQTGVDLPGSVYAAVTKPTFFPSAIAPAMATGFIYAYHIAAIMAFTAAVFSYLRGREHIVHQVKLIEGQSNSQNDKKTVDSDN